MWEQSGWEAKMRRRHLLFGVLCGVALTAGAVVLGDWLFRQWQTPRTMRHPARVTAANACRVFEPPAPMHPPGVPPDAHRFEFNGMPVYIVPLAAVQSSQEINR